MRTGEAWYGNTASFILDRFKDGRVSASAACCDYVLVMMLDDIGTKSKTPPLAPTWIIETSEGNYYVKCYGPAATMEKNVEAFNKMIESVRVVQ